MAEYIDREKALSTLENTAKYYEMPNADEWTKGIHYGLLHGVDNIVDNVPTEEVVDRAKFDNMVQILKDKNERLKQENIATRAKYLRLEEEYIKLRAKIEHVTEELENEARFWKEFKQYDVPVVDSASLAKVQSYRKALEIIRRITGESKDEE